MLVYNSDTENWEDDGESQSMVYPIEPPQELGDGAGSAYTPNQDDSAWEQFVAESQAQSEADYAANQTGVDAQTQEILAGMGQTEDTTGIGGAIKNIGTQALNALKAKYTTANGVDWLKVGADALKAGAAISAYRQASAGVPKTGYQGGIPAYKIAREQLAPTGIAAARPGAGGQRYFTDTQYTVPSGLAAAQAATGTQKTQLEAQNKAIQQAQIAQAAPTSTPAEQQAASDKFYGRVPAPATPKAAPPTVEGLYQQYLGRGAEASGADYWSNRFGSEIDPSEIETFKNAALAETNPVQAAQQGLWTSVPPVQAGPAYPIAEGNSAGLVNPMAFDKTYVQQTPQQISQDQEDLRVKTAANQPVRAAQGGLMELAKGGSTTRPGGTYLRGNTDGMADKLHATIDGNQPARLAHGEFVIPADVVSHLGNGNSDAGAKQLYKMMDRIRQARTGNKKQGKEINPEKFTPGGIAGYAAGGAVQHFVDGGTTGTPGAASGVTGTESNLSNWAGPYVTDMLAKGQALTDQPYQAYAGPLTAGESTLQTQAFGNAAKLAVPTSIGEAANTAGAVGTKMGNLSYTGNTAANQFTAPDKYATGTFTGGTFGAAQAQQYMNPYLQASLDPQLAEARRQADITRTQQAGQMTRAGAFGGGRQAIMESEGARNLGTNLANITGQGYNTAFGQAQQQFNTEQASQAARQQALEQSRQFGAGQDMTAAGQSAQYGQAAQAQTEASKQFGANYGLQALQGQLGAAQTQGQLGATQNAAGLANLQAQLSAGSQQRDIASQGIAADKTAFEAERDNPYKMVQFQQSLLQGLPLAAQSYSITNNPYTAAAGAAGAVNTAVS